MPSQTFLNLPPEKQARFMKAAIQEFSRVPFSEASINQIIRASEVARGSFYMYFEDKLDLFVYIINDYLEEFVQQINDALSEYKGDIFAALLALYEKRATLMTSGRQQDALNIISVNGELRLERLLERFPWKQTLGSIVNHLDRSKLRFHTDAECYLMVITLFKVILPYFFEKQSPCQNADMQHSYEGALNMLKYGI